MAEQMVSHLKGMDDKKMAETFIKMDEVLRQSCTYDEATKKFTLKIEPNKYIGVTSKGFPFAKGEIVSEKGRKFIATLYVGGKDNPTVSHAHLEYMKEDKLIKAKSTYVICNTKQGRKAYKRIPGAVPNSTAPAAATDKAPWDK